MADERARSSIGLFFGAMLIFGKSTKLIAALKVLKFTKPLVTLVSLLVSALAYGLAFGPVFGVGLVALIMIHEMGHVIALRLKGYETPGPVFIPFLGAAIFAPSFDDRRDEAFVGIGGPVLGTVGTLAFVAAWLATGSELLLVLSYAGAFLNLFNLIPVSPLDGGRITQAVGPWFRIVGLALLLGYTVFSLQPALILIWIILLESATRLPRMASPLIAGLLTVTMAGMFAAGYGGQPFWVSVMDVLLASGLTCFMLWRDLRGGRGTPTTDPRPLGDVPGRVRWLVAYAALALTLGGLVAYLAPHLPAKVHAHAQGLTETGTPND